MSIIIDKYFKLDIYSTLSTNTTNNSIQQNTYPIGKHAKIDIQMIPK